MYLLGKAVLLGFNFGFSRGTSTPIFFACTSFLISVFRVSAPFFLSLWGVGGLRKTVACGVGKVSVSRAYGAAPSVTAHHTVGVRFLGGKNHNLFCAAGAFSLALLDATQASCVS